MSTENIPSQEIQPKRPKRKYSDAQIASALITLDANGGNVFKTAHALSIPYKTLHEWSQSTRRINPEIVQMREEITRDLSDVMEETARTYLNQALDPYVVASTNGRDAVFAAAIAADKMQLLRGLPTAITASVMSEDERRLKISEILSRIAERAELADRGQSDQADSADQVPPDNVVSPTEHTD